MSGKPTTKRRVFSAEQEAAIETVSLRKFEEWAEKSGISVRHLDAGNGDHRWGCEQCSRVLGLYNDRTQTVRINYERMWVEFAPIGDNGHAATAKCRRCGWMNRFNEAEYPSAS